MIKIRKRGRIYLGKMGAKQEPFLCLCPIFYKVEIRSTFSVPSSWEEVLIETWKESCKYGDRNYVAFQKIVLD